MNSKLKFILAAALMAVIAATTVSCKDEEPKYQYQQRLVERIYINRSLMVYYGQTVSVQGKGFQTGDKVVFRNVDGDITLPLTEVNSSYASFAIPETLKRGDYVFYIARQGQEQKVCDVAVWITSYFEVPDKDGYNIKGAVYCDKVGIGGVRVSDGVVTTVTDENGYYWIASDKYQGYVFVSLPSGYMPANGTNVVPGFWSAITSDKSINEQCNFELKKVNNKNHTVIFAADFHLANRDSSNKDMTQFEQGFMADSRALATQYGTESTYLINLGDLTWDAYWYTQHYTPADFKDTMASYPFPMFCAMGNHDNNPYVQGDFAGEVLYKSIFGPTYFSFDLGDVHYVVFDDIVWKNTNGAEGTIGDRNYSKYLVDDGLNWMKEDIAAITDKNKPIVICTHAPLFQNYNSTFAVTKSGLSATSYVDQIVNIFNGYHNVHIMSGHTHHNDTVVVSDELIEHNVAAVCECWWWGGKLSGRAVCSDGTPSGISIFEVSGRDMEWYYKGFGCTRDEQMRAYDMNVVKSYLQPYISVLNKQTDSVRDTAGDDYGALGDNLVYLNVWDYDDSWTVEASENGTPLNVTRVYDRDPLHSISYDIPRVQAGGDLTSSNATTRNSHMFSVQASSATSTVVFKVTSRFGHVYTETVTRPKAFSVTMK